MVYVKNYETGSKFVSVAQWTLSLFPDTVYSCRYYDCSKL